MIKQLASPSVCVIDDEEEEYRPILAALNEMFVSCVHILGNSLEGLPPQPFKRVQLTFVDLHLSGTVGKDAASHTANVFTRVMSPDTAPIVVVIWSKYAKDLVAKDGVPPEDQDTEAELFKKTLLEAEPKYKGRLLFVEMTKPKPDDRPADWNEKLKAEITNALRDQAAVDLLWAWDSLVRDASAAVTASVTSIAAEQTGAELKDSLKATLQRLTRAQAENDLSAVTAPRHLMTVLGELLADQVEHTEGMGPLRPHGEWLAAPPATAPSPGFSARMNGFLMTAASTTGIPFSPGTVYRFRHLQAFASAFGRECESLVELLCNESSEAKRTEWRSAAIPVAVEVSPVCDVAQNNRATALLVAGVIVPENRQKLIKKGDSFPQLPVFHLRWRADNFQEQDAVMVFCHRYKAAIPAQAIPGWLVPWFRLRELPTTFLRNAQSAHSSRVGFVSVLG